MRSERCGGSSALCRKPSNGLRGSLRAAKTGESEIPFSAFAKTRTWCADEMVLCQQLVKKGPGCFARRYFEPDVRRAGATPDGISLFLKSMTELQGIAQIPIDAFLALRLAFFGEDGFCSPLHNIGNTIVFGGLSPQPLWMQPHRSTVSIRDRKVFGNNCIRTPQACKSRCF